MMEKFLKYFLIYWYFLYTTNTVFKIFGLPDFFSLFLLLIVISGILSLGQMKWKKVDILVLIAMIYSILSYVFSDYPFILYWADIRSQVSIMFFYFFARSRFVSSENFYHNFEWVLIITMLFGILLYFYPPAWYTSYRYADILAEEGSYSFYEASRMSSFFTHPYFLGYGSCFFIIYIVKKIIVDRSDNYINYILLLLSMFTLFFAQMRVAIAFILLFFILLATYNIIFLKNSKFTKFSFLMIPTGVLLFYFIKINLNVDFLDYILSRSIGHESNIVEDRIGMFSYFEKFISIFGYGLGRFGHQAVSLKMPSCSDNDYLRCLGELGFVGFGMLLLPIIYSLLIGCLNLRKYFFETFVVLFFLFAMVGATPLEAVNQHNFLLWFCVGVILTNKRGLKTI